MENSLNRLEAWCAERALGEWDRGSGVRIESLEDPGWRVRVDLRGTGLESRDFDEVRELCPGEAWMHCRIRNGVFEGCGGPFMLDRILSSFLLWASTESAVAALQGAR